MNEKIVVGLDIGTDKVKVIAATAASDNKIRLLGKGEAPSKGVIRSNIVNIDKTVLAIEQAIEMASKHAKIRIRGANISITGSHIQSKVHHSSITRESEEGEVSSADVMRLNRDMYRMVTSVGRETIHVIPRDYSVDYQANVRDPIGMSGVRLEGNFHVVTAQTNSINNIYKCLSRAGIEVDNLIFSSVAASVAVLTEQEKEMGVCVVDMGASTTGVTIYHGGTLQHLATIPFGGNSVTKDISKAFMIMEPQAEILKKKYASGYEKEEKHAFLVVPGFRNRQEKQIPLPLLTRVVSARMEEIVEMIHTEIVRSGNREKLAAGIVLTSGAAQLKNIEALFSYMTSGMSVSGYQSAYDTRLAYPYEYLIAEENELPPIEYASAVGLALLASSKSTGDTENLQKKRGQQIDEEPESKQEGGLWGFFRKLL